MAGRRSRRSDPGRSKADRSRGRSPAGSGVTGQDGERLHESVAVGALGVPNTMADAQPKPTKRRRKKRSPKQCAADLAIEKRREKACDLRLAGWSIRAIATHLKCGATTVHEDISAVLERTRDAAIDAIDKERRLSLARLDVAVKALWTKVRKGDGEAIRELVRLEQRRAKLLGIDAADKHEVSGPGGGGIPVDMTAKASLAVKLDDLRARLAGAAAGAPAVAEPGGDPRPPA